MRGHLVGDTHMPRHRSQLDADLRDNHLLSQPVLGEQAASGSARLRFKSAGFKAVPCPAVDLRAGRE